jgi:hypothetical protein
VDRLYIDTKGVLALKEVQDAFAAQGFQVIGNAPDVAAQFFQTELDKHTNLVKHSGAAVD